MRRKWEISMRNFAAPAPWADFWPPVLRLRQLMLNQMVYDMHTSTIKELKTRVLSSLVRYTIIDPVSDISTSMYVEGTSHTNWETG